MKTSLEHLPESKREQIQAIARLVQAEASVEMVVLFGSYARGDWVEDPANGYFSDFDILVVVATEEQARNTSLWTGLSQRARAVAGQVPVTLIVHDIKEINHEIRLGQYFFKDIVREGVLLYTSRRHSFASPRELAPGDKLRLGLVNFRYWFGSANEFWRGAGYFAGRGLGPHAAFLLHQAVERYYNATQLIFTDYKTKTHNIETQAEMAAPLHPALAGALPRTEKEDERLFDLLKRGYIDARYSKSYKITLEELRILRERVLDLAVRVRQACAEKLASLCGPEAVGELPEVPSIADIGELPEAPSFDDASALQAWREAITSLSFDRGKEVGFDRGEKAGFDRGLTEGEQKGQIRAIWAILAARGIPVSDDARARIEACRDTRTLDRWITRAATASSAEEILAAEEGT